MNRHKFLSRGRTVKYKGSYLLLATDDAKRRDWESMEIRSNLIDLARAEARNKKEAK